MTDLCALKGSPLTDIGIAHPTMNDLAPIRDAKVQTLFLPSVLFDVNIVPKWPLESIDFYDKVAALPDEKLETLRNHPTLKAIDGKPVAEFWKNYDEANPKK